MKRKDIVCYVCGPITKGPLDANIRQACEAGMALLKAGLSPVVPHLSCFMGAVAVPNAAYSRRPAYIPEVLPEGTVHADWIGACLPQVRRSDCVLRLPGESVGSDMETAEAMRNGIPVFFTVREVLEWAETK